MRTALGIANFMDASKTIDTQVTLPQELYHAAQRAQLHGHSVSREIVALLTPLSNAGSQ